VFVVSSSGALIEARAIGIIQARIFLSGPPDVTVGVEGPYVCDFVSYNHTVSKKPNGDSAEVSDARILWFLVRLLRSINHPGRLTGVRIRCGCACRSALPSTIIRPVLQLVVYVYSIRVNFFAVCDIRRKVSRILYVI
jgi:hypothetical protein